MSCREQAVVQQVATSILSQACRRSGAHKAYCLMDAVGLSAHVKRPEREANRSHQFSFEAFDVVYTAHHIAMC